MKSQTPLFSCSHCDAQFSKWSGQCSSCGKWGTLTEDQSRHGAQNAHDNCPGKTEAFAKIHGQATHPKTHCGIDAYDRVLGGGFVSGSVTLLGGEPGIGKSTLLAQVALSLASQDKPVLYVTGEESPSQVALRLKRLFSTLPPSLEFLDDTDAQTIAATIRDKKPTLTIVDSVQSLRMTAVSGEPGNPGQIRASAGVITEAAKQSQSPVILVGQVTKDGDLAGPRLLEHLVDTVLMMEGDRQQLFRLLRVLKHRFGNTDELAVLHMTEKGLEEVPDPSSQLIADRPANAPGTIVSCLSQGTRPLLVEIQALVNPAGYGTPTRRASGVDPARLSLLLAVLARRCSINLSDHDVFVNVVGGVDAREPAIDLPLCFALTSAKYDTPIAHDVAAWGEVGLSGELRPVTNQAGRLKEATRLGFKKIIAPSKEYKSIKETLEELKLKTADKRSGIDHSK